MSSSFKIDSSIYYNDIFWNGYSKVIEYMSENFSGDKSIYWLQDFKNKYCNGKFKCALSFNCGNGWVERAFIDQEVVEKIIAFDISEDLLRIAKKDRQERQIDYFQADVNQIDFPENKFDLIINVAALHHVQYIDRFVRILSKSLKPDGLFVNFDYIGPHRNQYPFSQWQLVKKINQELPANARRSPLLYPHLPTMLAVDPTEAVHSELIINTVKQYFEILERHDTAGGIAYEILSHNENIAKLDTKSQDEVIDFILDLDKKFTLEKKVPPLFTYFVARPEKSVFADLQKLKKLEESENRREKRSIRLYGSYYLSEYLKMFFHHRFVYILHKYPKFGAVIKQYLKQFV